MLGEFLALVVTAADKVVRAPIQELAAQIQTGTGSTIDLAYVDQGYTGADAATVVDGWGIWLEESSFLRRATGLRSCYYGGSSSGCSLGQG